MREVIPVLAAWLARYGIEPETVKIRLEVVGVDERMNLRSALMMEGQPGDVIGSPDWGKTTQAKILGMDLEIVDKGGLSMEQAARVAEAASRRTAERG